MLTIEEEYRRNPDIQKKDIQEILDWIESQEHLPLMDEIEIIQIYHSNYYDVKKTKKSIELYFTYRTHFTDMFKNMDVESEGIKKAFETL